MVLHYVKSLNIYKVSLHLLWDKQECRQTNISQNYLSYFTGHKLQAKSLLGPGGEI